MTEQTAARTPDYDLDEVLELTTPEQLKALGDPLRVRIVGLLAERAATTKQLAVALDRPVGTVGYHCKVLESAGLIHVVRTRVVRAVTAKYYGRTARTFSLVGGGEDARGHRHTMLHEALDELDHDRAPGHGGFTLRHARIPHERADEWLQRLVELAVEFAEEPRGGDVTYGLLVGVYPTDWGPLPRDDHGDDA
jgi:DNA-binding transcriptional ArsR family regulator